MDLLRVPLLFATAAAIDKAFTAPNPNATAKERVPITNALERFIWAIEIPHAGGREACKLFGWFAASAESFLILSRYGIFPEGWTTSLTRILAPAGTPAGFAASPSLLLMLGAIIAMYGIYFRASAYLALGRHFTFHVSLKENHSLIKAWPYSVVRHPSYTGSYILALGCILIFSAPDGWVRAIAWPQIICQGSVVGLLIALVTLRSLTHWILVLKMFWDRTSSEDALLKKQFGKQWDEWAQSVPFRLLPGVY